MGPKRRFRRPHKRRRQRVKFKPITLEEVWQGFELRPDLDGLPIGRFNIGVRVTP